MASVIFDLKGILMPRSCIEEFGKDLTLYNIRNGSENTFNSLATGAASAIAKRFGNGHAYSFAKYAFKGAPKKLVKECSEKYRKLIPNESKSVVKKIKDLVPDVGIITHDIGTLCSGVYDELGIRPENVKDNDFSFHNNRVSGVVLNQDGWPRAHDKASVLRDYVLRKGYCPEDVILVGHGCEEIPMVHAFKDKIISIIVPEKGCCRKLKDDSRGTYKHLESLPEMIDTALNPKSILPLI